MIKRDLKLMKVPNGDEICQIQLMKLIDKVVATDVNHQIDKYLPSIEEKLAHLDKEGIIKHFVSTEFNRFLAFYKNAQDLNVLGSKGNDRNDRNERGSRADRKGKRGDRGERTGHAESGHTRFFINLGQEKDMQAHNLIGLINECTRNRNIPVGKIDIMRKFSFFEIPSDFETDILSGMVDANWNGNRVNVEVSQAPGIKSPRGGGNRSGGGRSYGGGDRKRSNSGRGRDRSGGRSSGGSSSRRESSVGGGRSSGGSSSSFKGRFNAAAKRKRRD
jgi:ATP-dependent RNA helicase DeaD